VQLPYGSGICPPSQPPESADPLMSRLAARDGLEVVLGGAAASEGGAAAWDPFQTRLLSRALLGLESPIRSGGSAASG